jgi:hypothetical protein
VASQWVAAVKSAGGFDSSKFSNKKLVQEQHTPSILQLQPIQLLHKTNGASQNEPI